MPDPLSPPSGPSLARPTVAIVGASADRAKFGNKAVRAYLEEGWEVFPVHPAATEIEGRPAFKSVLDIPVPLERVLFYVPPAVGLRMLPEAARKGCRELWLAPGAESDDIIEAATQLKLNVIVACPIVGIGVSPDQLK